MNEKPRSHGGGASRDELSGDGLVDPVYGQLSIASAAGLVSVRANGLHGAAVQREGTEATKNIVGRQRSLGDVLSTGLNPSV